MTRLPRLGQSGARKTAALPGPRFCRCLSDQRSPQAPEARPRRAGPPKARARRRAAARSAATLMIVKKILTASVWRPSDRSGAGLATATRGSRIAPRWCGWRCPRRSPTRRRQGRPPARRAAVPGLLRLHRRGLVQRLRPGTVAPLHHHLAQVTGPPGRAHRPGPERSGPGLLRQGRRIPASRRRPLPRHHPARRPRRASRPTGRLGHHRLAHRRHRSGCPRRQWMFS